MRFKRFFALTLSFTVLTALAPPASASATFDSTQGTRADHSPTTMHRSALVKRGYKLPGRTYSAPFLAVASAVGTETQLSPTDSNAYSETAIGYSPSSPTNLLGGSNVIPTTLPQPQPAYRSTNSGSTWIANYAPLPAMPPNSYASDPGLAFDTLGKAYYSYIAVGNLQTQLVVSSSTDNGATWSTPVQLETSNNGPDKPLIAVDTSAGPTANNIYVAYTNFLSNGNRPIMLATSSNRGTNWTTNQVVNGLGDQGGYPVVDSSGKVYVAWDDEINNKVMVASSTNGGASFASPVTIASVITGTGVTLANYSSGTCSGGAKTLLSFPAIDVDRSQGQYKGYLYAVWADGGTQGQRMSIHFSRSTTGGASWSNPVLVDIGNSNDAWEPTVAVDQSNGRLTLAWYDRRDSVFTDPNHLYRVYYTQSSDGGATFLPQQIAITTRQSDPTVDCNGTGDYMQMVALGGVAHPLWADTRNIVNGNHVEQIFTASIQDSAPINNWFEPNPANVPPGRTGAAMAYVPSSGQIVMFGGFQADVGILLNDTWTWDGNNWTQRHPTNSPSPRWLAAMTYDPATGYALLFGGHGSSIFGDTWKWDGTNWTILSPRTSPPARQAPSIAFYAPNSTVLIFGGSNISQAFSDTWTWNGTTWTQLRLKTTPGARYAAAMAYDPSHSVAVLFGGYNYSVELADTWTWNGTVWTKQSPATSPAKRDGSGFDYDTFLGAPVLFGGNDEDHNPVLAFNDTWLWSGTNWIQQQPTSMPTPRYYFPMLYDGATRTLTLFGGYPSGTETWTY